MVEIVQIAKWFSMGTVGGANSKGGEGRFQYEAVGIPERLAAAWWPRRDGGRGRDRADMGRSSAPLHGRGLRMSCGKTHRTGRVATSTVGPTAATFRTSKSRRIHRGRDYGGRSKPRPYKGKTGHE